LNADKQAHKCLKDKTTIESGEEEKEELKMKGGRGGKKAKGIKKKQGIRFVPTPPCLIFTNQFYRKTSADKAREEAAAEAAKVYM